METQGRVKSLRHDNKGLQLDTGEWYSSFHNQINCKQGDEVKISFTDNTKDGRTYHNFDKIEVTAVAPEDKFGQARESKDASQLTSYAKDLVIAMMQEKEDIAVDVAFPVCAKLVAEAYNQIKDIISGEEAKEKEKEPEFAAPVLETKQG